MRHVQHLTNKELKEAIRTKYAWPGGYEIYGITSDGAALCCDCMRREYQQIARARKEHYSDGWRVDALDSTATCDIDRLDCDHCNKVIWEPEVDEDDSEGDEHGKV